MSIPRAVPPHQVDPFQLLVEAVQDYAIYMVNPDGQVVSWNSGAEKITGYRAEEIVGRSFSCFFTPEDVQAQKPQRELELARAQGRFEVEGFRRRKDGSPFWAHVVLTSVYDGQGSLLGFAKVTRDLTERVRAERTAEELRTEQAFRAMIEATEARARASEASQRALSARLAVILEGVADGITVQEPSGRLVFANGAAARSCGFASAEEMTSVEANSIMARFEVFDEKGQPIASEELPGRRVLRGEPPCAVLMRVRDKGTGREWWSHVRSQAVLGDDGKPSLAINIWHDVTAQRRREEHERYVSRVGAVLAESLDYRQMLAKLAALLVPGVADWCSVYLLERGELRNVTVAHADPEKVKAAQDYTRRFPPSPQQARGVWSVVRTGAPVLHAEVTEDVVRIAARDSEHEQVIRAVGMRSVVIVPIQVGDRILGTISLISAESGRRYDELDLALGIEVGRRAGQAIENARLYAAEREAAERAEQANRVKDEFLATVSHELRTPLNAIVGWAARLRAGNADPGVLAKGIDVIQRNALAQAKIIDDILDVSRIITGKLRLELDAVDLTAVVRDALEVVGPSATAKRISLELSAPPSCMLVADASRLQQVAWNLLSNAIKFTETNGRVTVAIRQLDSKLELSVTDTGRGIAPGFLPAVFDRFQQEDGSPARRFGGLGLGLAIVRHLVELHGGQVEAESAGIGRGSTFTVLLPIRAVAPHGAPSAQREAEVPREEERVARLLDGRRVLLVDDEDDARELLAEVLVDAGASVETAATAAEGLAALQRFQPHVLVSDIGLPGEDGYAFMGRVKALREGGGAQLPSIALTAYTRSEEKHRALAAGFTTHLGKPVHPDVLVAAVASLAASGSA